MTANTTANGEPSDNSSRVSASVPGPTLWIKRGPHLLEFHSYTEVFSVPGSYSNQYVYIQRYRGRYAGLERALSPIEHA